MTKRSLELHHRLGVFDVQGRKYFNKYEAFIDATKNNVPKVNWDFNDSVFGSIDWKTPIETPLAELYKQRALQLRAKYDYVSVYFSGGVDSANIIKAFIDNGIFLDEIVMLRPAVIDNLVNKTDRTNRNLYAEIKYAAIPWLKDQSLDPRTVVRLLDLGEHLDTFVNEELMEQYKGILGPAICVNSFAKNVTAIKDPIWQELYRQGKKVCHIQGADKPLISVDQDKYYFQFHNHVAWHFAPEFDNEESKRIEEHQFMELFYWTPDLPELVIKQCQVVKQKCEEDRKFKRIFEAKGVMQDHYLKVIETIYSSEVNRIRELFCTSTSGVGLNGNSGDWMYQYASNKVNQAFWNNVKYMRDHIADRFWISVPLEGPRAVYLEDQTSFSSDKMCYRIANSQRYYL